MMTFEKACEKLKEVIHPDGGLYSLGWYLAWDPKFPASATLDGQFTADDLEAIAVYMRGKDASK